MHSNFRIDSTCWSVVLPGRDFRLLQELGSIRLLKERQHFPDLSLIEDKRFGSKETYYLDNAYCTTGVL